MRWVWGEKHLGMLPLLVGVFLFCENTLFEVVLRGNQTGIIRKNPRMCFLFGGGVPFGTFGGSRTGRPGFFVGSAHCLASASFRKKNAAA